MPPPTRSVTVDCPKDVDGLSRSLVTRAISAVLDGEDADDAEFSVAFLSAQRMRALNRRLFGRDRATDVIAFGLRHTHMLVGDIYICPPVARKSAVELKIPEQEELLRLVVHGTLHSLGYDHPSGGKRYSSEMWRVQEAYLRQLIGGGK
jgi:probable rRNA maturation factor